MPKKRGYVWFEATSRKCPIAEEEYYNPCWGFGLAIGFGGAVPEEILKMLTIAVFMRRGWIADPFAVLVYSFVTGATFGFAENFFTFRQP